MAQIDSMSKKQDRPIKIVSLDSDGEIDGTISGYKSTQLSARSEYFRAALAFQEGEEDRIVVENNDLVSLRYLHALRMTPDSPPMVRGKNNLKKMVEHWIVADRFVMHETANMIANSIRSALVDYLFPAKIAHMEAVKKQQSEKDREFGPERTKEELQNVIVELAVSDLPYTSPLMLLFINFILARITPRGLEGWLARSRCCRSVCSWIRKQFPLGTKPGDLTREQYTRLAEFLDMLHVEARDDTIEPFYRHRCHFHYHEDSDGKPKCKDCVLPEQAAKQIERLAKYKSAVPRHLEHHCGRAECDTENRCEYENKCASVVRAEEEENAARREATKVKFEALSLSSSGAELKHCFH